MVHPYSTTELWQVYVPFSAEEPTLSWSSQFSKTQLTLYQFYLLSKKIWQSCHFSAVLSKALPYRTYSNSPVPAVKEEEPPNASGWVAEEAGWKPRIKFSVELPIFSGAFPETPDTVLGEKLPFRRLFTYLYF